MKKITVTSFSLFLLLCVAFGVSNTAFGQKVIKTQNSFSKIKELQPRGGLPNFFYKLSHQRKVHLSYFGGSITAAEHAWRDMTYDWLRVEYPLTIITHTNSSIPGTGSDLGASRVDRDVIAYKPDLVFVEFAVNDHSMSQEIVKKTMETIVRKIWTTLPSTDICFLYTIAEEDCKPMLNGNIPSSIQAMEEVAGHYNIPSIQLGIKVVNLLKAGKLTFTGDSTKYENTIIFTKDGIHPVRNSGYPIYANTVVRCLKKMSEQKAIFKPHVLPKALY